MSVVGAEVLSKPTLSKRKSFTALRAPSRSSSAAVPLRIVTLSSMLAAGGSLPPLKNDRASSFHRSDEPRIRQSLSLTPEVGLEETTASRDLPLVVVSQPTNHHALPEGGGRRRGRGRGGYASPRIKRAASADFEGIATKRRRGPTSDSGADENGPRSPLSVEAPALGVPQRTGRGRGRGRGGARSASRMASPAPPDPGSQNGPGLGAPSGSSSSNSTEDMRRISRSVARPTHLQDYEIRATSEGQ